MASMNEPKMRPRGGWSSSAVSWPSRCTNGGSREAVHRNTNMYIAPSNIAWMSPTLQIFSTVKSGFRLGGRDCHGNAGKFPVRVAANTAHIHRQNPLPLTDLSAQGFFLVVASGMFSTHEDRMSATAMPRNAMASRKGRTAVHEGAQTG